MGNRPSPDSVGGNESWSSHCGKETEVAQMIEHAWTARPSDVTPGCAYDGLLKICLSPHCAQ